MMRAEEKIMIGEVDARTARFEKFPISGGVNLLASDKGSVESAMTLIPLMVLILSILQIAMGVLARDVIASKTESSVTKSSLYQPFGLNPFEQMKSSGIEKAAGLNLTGGGVLYIGEARTRLPSLTPLLPQGETISSLGVSVGEAP